MKDESISRVMIGRISRSKGNISHDTINFVDDSASIISFEDEEEAEDYIEMFMEILEEFYSINKLKINKNKTAILVFANSNSRIKEADIRVSVKMR